jgi:hypothetical protein
MFCGNVGIAVLVDIPKKGKRGASMLFRIAAEFFFRLVSFSCLVIVRKTERKY